MDNRENVVDLTKAKWDSLEEKYPIPTDEKNIRIAAYCRVSTNFDDQMSSIENQKRYYMRQIGDTINWQLVGIYTDQGKSGTEYSKRLGFLRMLRHCEEGKIDKILCKSISRFGRNTKDVLEVLYRLKELNIGVFFEKENIDTLLINSEFVLATIAALAQEEIREIAENANWSVVSRFQQGIPIFRRILGYDLEKDNGRTVITINEKEAVVVREIFDLALHGIGYSEIARLLMSKGYKTAKEKSEWDAQAVIRVLTNERYTGNVLCQKSYTVDFLSHNEKENMGERPKYLIEGFHPSIISLEIFEIIQSGRTKSEKGKKMKNLKYHLSSRIICGICGATYQISKRRSEVIYWRCGRSIKNNNLCRAKSINETFIEHFLREAFLSRYDPSNRLIFREIIQDIKRIQDNDNFELNRICMNSKLVALNDMKLISKGEELDDLEKKRFELEGEIERLKKYWRYIEEDRPYRIKTIEWLEKLPHNENSMESIVKNLDISLMRALILNVTVYSSDSYVIRWADDFETTISGDEDNNLIKKSSNHALKTNYKNRIYKEESNITTDYITRLKQADIKESFQYEPKLWSIPALPKSFYIQSDATKKKVCAYCRVSTNMHEQLSSFNLQVIHYTDHIKGNKEWRFSGIYADEGVSGTSTKKRTNFLKMIKDCEDGKIDLILTKSISRFTRNTVDCLHYIRLLKNLPVPVGVYFEKENINTLDMNGEFLLTILSSLGQEEANATAFNTSWGIQKQFQQGIVSCSPPYGYRADKNGEWIINDKEGDVIRRIYREYLFGKEIKQIAIGLMEDGIKTKKGNQVWSHTSIYLVLTNEKYCGDVLMQKTFKPDYLTHKTVANRGQLPQYFLEDHHPAIVEKAEWNAVQEKRKSKRCGKVEPILPLKPRKKYLFSKLLYCQNCGGALERILRKSLKNGEKHNFNDWRCKNAYRKVINTECHASSCKEEKIEKAFMSMLYEMKQEQDVLTNEVRYEIENNRLDESEIERMDILQNKILDLYDQFTDAATSIKADLDDALSGKRLNEISEQIEMLNSEWGKLNEKQEIEQNISKNLKWLISELKKLGDSVEISGTKTFREDIFKRLVKRGIVYVDNRIIFEMSIGISREV